MFQTPPASADPTDLADWLEVAALTADQGRSSIQDLVAAIRSIGSVDALADSGELIGEQPLDALVASEEDRLEPLADAAFHQIAIREECLGEGYPFEIGGALKAKTGAQDSVYSFLAAATLLGSRSRAASENLASLFEDLSREALVRYLGGRESVRGLGFGFPRVDGPKGFYDAVNALCKQMGEGLGCRATKQEAAGIKDSKLDVVAWIPFGDSRTNQLIVFGQCSTGRNWRHKLNELLPESFCKLWLMEQPASTPSSAFFVPRHIEERHWPEAAVGSQRILFDRLRLASWLSEMDAELARRCAAWTASVLA